MKRSISVRWPIVGALGWLFVSAALLIGFSQAAPAQTVRNVVVHVYSDGSQMIQGPDGKYHDVFIPSSFVLRAGEPVRLTFVNYDDGRHTFTAPDLGLNIQIKPGLDLSNGNVAPTVTTYTFTPSRKGTFRWFCAYKCDPWTMVPGVSGPSREFYMAGYITVN